jgi:hypothetical protein
MIYRDPLGYFTILNVKTVAVIVISVVGMLSKETDIFLKITVTRYK